MHRKTSIAVGQLIVMILMLISSIPAKAQLCTPDPSLSGRGVLPDTLPAACAGSYYEFSATVRVPGDTTVSQPPIGQVDVEICWNRLDSLQNVPNGLGVQCDPSLQDSCKYPGDSTNCALVSGTPSIADTGWHEVFIFSTGKGCPKFDGGCSGSSNCELNVVTDTIYIRVDAPVTAQVSNDTLLCPGESVQLMASGGQSYHWSPASGLSDTSVANPVASPNTTTQYNVTVSGGACPSEVDTVNVARNNLSVDAGSNTNVSVGNNATLGGNPAVSGGTTPYNINWTPDSNFTSGSSASDQNPEASFTATGTFTYTLEVTDDDGCTLTDNVTITVTGGQLAADAGTDDTVCRGQSTTIGGSPTAVGGDSPYDYAWSSAASLNNDTLANPEAASTSTTTYTVTVTDDNGNTDTDTLTVTVLDTPTLNTAPDASICVGTSTGIGVSPSGGSGPYTYSWTPVTTIQNPTSQNPTATPVSTTTYNVDVTDANGCVGTGDVKITVNQLPNADAGSDKQVCKGDSVTLNASGGDEYQWTPAATLDDNMSASPQAFPVSNTLYALTVTSSVGCQDTDSVKVVVQNNPSVSIEEPAADTTVADSFLVMAPGGFNSYNWSNGETTQNIWVTSTGAYSVTVTNNNGCTASDTTNITISGIDSRKAFAQELSVHPNPNKGSFTITLSAEGSVEGYLKLFSLRGQILRQQKASLHRGRKQLQMDLQEQSSGLYYLQLKTEKGVINRKVIVR